MENIDFNSIPDDLKKIIKKKIENNPKYMELARRRSLYIQNGNYMMAMMTSEAMAKVEELIRKHIISEYAADVIKVDTLTKQMNDDDKGKMNTYGNMLSMVVDMFDTLTMETNQLLKKYHPNYRIEMFDKLIELGKEAKMHVKIRDAAVRDKYCIDLYGDTCDKLFEMCYNKSKSF